MKRDATIAPPRRPVRRDRQGGSTMVELLLALPVVMLLSLGIAQFTLVYQAKHALDYALTQAARQGAVDHASPASIRQGLAAGLVPYLYGASDFAGLLAAEARGEEHVAQGAAAGWIRLRQRSPSLESFDDWGEPALDAMGEAIPGLLEIPNDNLDNRRTRAQPLSGVAGLRLAEPIGRVSRQTLADANLLRLELVYGVRLGVPVVGTLILRTLSAWNRCSSAGSATPGAQRLGLLVLGPVRPLDETPAWKCAYFDARDDEDRADGRIPIRLSSTMRMMSTARRSDTTRSRQDLPSGLASLGAGQFDSPGSDPLPGDRSDGASPSPAPSPASSPSPAPSPRSSLSTGFLSIGSDRPYSMPGTHPALCPG